MSSGCEAVNLNLRQDDLIPPRALGKGNTKVVQGVGCKPVGIGL